MGTILIGLCPSVFILAHIHVNKGNIWYTLSLKIVDLNYKTVTLHIESRDNFILKP